MSTKTKMAALLACGVIVIGCSSTLSVRGPLMREALNNSLKGRDASIELKNGEMIPATKVYLSRDSVAWSDVRGNRNSAQSLRSLKRITVKNHFLGGLEGMVCGIPVGIGVGWLLTPRQDYDEGGLLYNMIIQGGVWGAGGLIAGAIIGHSYNYEMRAIQIQESRTKDDVLYLASGEVINGRIIAQYGSDEDLEYVGIRKLDGTVQTYYASEIDRIDKAKELRRTK